MRQPRRGVLRRAAQDSGRMHRPEAGIQMGDERRRCVLGARTFAILAVTTIHRVGALVTALDTMPHRGMIDDRRRGNRVGGHRHTGVAFNARVGQGRRRHDGPDGGRIGLRPVGSVGQLHARGSLREPDAVGDQGHAEQCTQ